jgi:hypothetical protein
LAGNLVKPLLSLCGTEWRERGYGISKTITIIRHFPMIFALTVLAILVTINNMAVPVLLQLHCTHCVCVPAVPDPASRCASSARKIRPLEKKLGRKPATPPNHKKNFATYFCANC